MSIWTASDTPIMSSWYSLQLGRSTPVGRCRIWAWCKMVQSKGWVTSWFCSDRVNFCSSQEKQLFCTTSLHCQGWGRESFLQWEKMAVVPIMWSPHVVSFCLHVNCSSFLHTLLIILLLLLFNFLFHCCFQWIVLISAHNLYLFSTEGNSFVMETHMLKIQTTN